MNQNRKGQAAIEFMMTYGWAILVVMIAIAALATFGIMNPSKYLSDKCMFTNNFQCIDYQINTTTTAITLVNGLGHKVYNFSAIVTDTGTSCDTSAVSNPWIQDIRKTITCDTSNLSFIKKDKGKVKITLNYAKVQGGFSQVATGEIYATVQ
ncbi:MAG: hypothetical protein WC916_04920 [Candidatus Woesearchaeota archaeon]